MAGLYLHVPYCRQACHYCDFHFSTQLGTQEEMVESMGREVETRIPEPRMMQTWYWGGGTPSLLTSAQVKTLVDGFIRHTPLVPKGEFTLEANPEDVSDVQLRSWREIGVNRLSMGIQTFVDRRLVWMNRAHSGEQARDAVRRAQDAGLENITVDLMYGLPETSLSEWQENVGQALELGVPHLSTYALTVEDKTALHHQIKKGTTSAPKDERAREDFLWLRSALRTAGWEPYELSNASKPGMRAQHNSAYWSGEAYVGIGPGAHSYDGAAIRQWNVSHNLRYIRGWKPGASPEGLVEVEVLSLLDQKNERIMTSLRRMEGLLRSDMGPYAETLDRRWKSFLENGWMTATDSGWVLTDEGLLWMDMVAAEGFATADDLGTFVSS